MRVRILTYNVFGMPWGSKELNEILMWIFCKSQAHIVCLQEVFSTKARRLIQEKADAAHWKVFFPQDPCFAGRFLNAYHSGSGLCILVHPRIQVLDLIDFQPYAACDAYIEKIVSKGYFGLRFRIGSKAYILYNTHMVSDFTECKPIRISHFQSRRLQEKQLLETARSHDETVFMLGDFNTEEFHYLCKPYNQEGWTYSTTEEQIDHLACLPEARGLFPITEVLFFQDIRYSDHIPVRFELEL